MPNTETPKAGIREELSALSDALYACNEKLTRILAVLPRTVADMKTDSNSQQKA